MRNGFAKFAKWVVNFAMRNFAKVGTNEQCIGIAKLKLALRNWLWHCEIEFGIAKLALALRNAQYPADTVPLVLHPAAHILSSTASHFLHFSFDFPLIFGLFNG